MSPSSTEARITARGVLLAATCCAIFAAALTGMLVGADPWATWFYPLAWYPTLVLAELFLRSRGSACLSTDPRFALSLFAWSVPFWLLFELVNFRVENWYYVFLPPHPVERWAGIVLSFATVLPAVFVGRALARELGVGRTVSWRRLTVGPGLPTALQAVGAVFVVLSLGWPLYFFPLIWGAVTLLLDPWVYRRHPQRSLLGALERGRPGVILQLLGGGLAIGFLWELYNVAARGKWIYTVPGLEELKLFEMPLLGFLGFPVLALDAWAVWNALVLAGVAPVAGESGRPGRVPPRGGPERGRTGVWVVTLTASVACGGILLGMERHTIDSVRPRLPDIVGEHAPALSLAGHDPFTLVTAEPSALASAMGVEESEARAWVELAGLATLRGIGAENARRLRAAGVGTVQALATADPSGLAVQLGADGYHEREKKRIWVAAAAAHVLSTGAS